MYRILIKRITREDYSEEVNLVTKEIPTDKVDRYNEKLIQREYQIVTQEKTREVERDVLKQEIEDETKFDLAAVIKAVNGL